MKMARKTTLNICFKRISQQKRPFLLPRLHLVSPENKWIRMELLGLFSAHQIAQKKRQKINKMCQSFRSWHRLLLLEKPFLWNQKKKQFLKRHKKSRQKKANKKRLKRQKKRKSLFLFLAEKLKNKEDFSALNQQGLLYLDNHLQQTLQKLDFSATWAPVLQRKMLARNQLEVFLAMVPHQPVFLDLKLQQRVDFSAHQKLVTRRNHHPCLELKLARVLEDHYLVIMRPRAEVCSTKTVLLSSLASPYLGPKAPKRWKKAKNQRRKKLKRKNLRLWWPKTRRALT